MKKKDFKNLIIKKRKLLFVIIIFAMLLFVILYFTKVYQGQENKCRYMPPFLTDSMQETEFGNLSNNAKSSVGDENIEQAVLDGLENTAEISNSVTVMGEKLMQQMQDDLESISQYLSDLDKTVTINKDEILNLSIAEGMNYEYLLSYLENLSSDVSSLKNNFINYQKDYATSQNNSKIEFDNINNQFNNIYNQLDSIQMHINQSQSKIEKSIQNLEISDNERFESISNMIKKLSSSTNESFETISTNITDILTDIQKNSKDQNAGLIEKLQKSQDELVTILTAITESNFQQHKEAEQKGAEWYKETEQNNSERYISLIEKLNGVHNNIILTQQDIKKTLDHLKEVDSDHMNVILDEFKGIKSALANVNTNMNTAHEELNLIIESVKNAADKNQAELLSSLNNIDVAFTEQSTQNYNSLLESLIMQSDNMLSQFDSMLTENATSINQSITEGIGESKTELTQKLASFQDSMNQNYNTLNQNVNNISTGISGNQQNILQRIQELSEMTNNKLSALDNSLNSVFQSVSDGKKIIATALLTKNVNTTVAQDATFIEIRDAILTIPQKIVIGVEEIPGEIEYEYHYHTGNASSGGGCYTIRQYHQHSPSCYTSATCNPYCLGLTSGTKNDRRIYHYDSRFMHPDCGAGIEYRSPYHHDGEGCNCASISSHQYQKLDCGMDNNTAVGWGVGCGFVDGQIIGAKITYTETQIPKTSLSMDGKQNKGYVPPSNIYSQEEEIIEEAEIESVEVIETESIKETELETDIETETDPTKETEMQSEKDVETQQPVKETETIVIMESESFSSTIS